MHKCFDCGDKFVDIESVYRHIEREHSSSIPKDFTVEQYHYMKRTGKTHGRCVICHADTKWNTATNKYHRMCGKQSCKDKNREICNARMMGVHGKITLLNDADHQRKMLANRKISGTYRWKGAELTYTGSYELEFLRFLTIVMDHPVEDIMAPSPNTYYYMYKGEKKFYIPDFYIPSLNLEIEIKDGGDNPNRHHKIQAVDKVKERSKDRVMTTQKDVSYIKIINKNHDTYVDFLLKSRDMYNDKGEVIPLFMIDDASKSWTSSLGVLESARSAITVEDKKMIEEAVDSIMEVHSYDNSLVIESLQALLEEESADEAPSEEVSDDAVEQPDDYITNVSADSASKEYDASSDDMKIVPMEKPELTGEGISKEEHDQNAQQAISDTDADIQQGREKAKREMEKAVKESMEATLPDNVKRTEPIYVLLTHTGTMLANVISDVTGDEFSHSSLSFDSSLNNMFSFGRKYQSNPLVGRFVQEDIRKKIFQKEGVKYGLYVTLVTPTEKEAMIDRVSLFLRQKDSFKYSIRGLVRFKLGVRSNNINSYFCSQFVDSILREANDYFPDKHSSEIKPQDFAHNHRFHLVASGLMKDYNPKVVDRNVAILKKSGVSQINPVTKPSLVYIPLPMGTTNRRIHVDVNDSSMNTRYTITVPTNLKTLREVMKMSHDVVKQDQMSVHDMYYAIVNIDGRNVELVDFAEDSAVITIPNRLRVDNINIL